MRRSAVLPWPLRLRPLRLRPLLAAAALAVALVPGAVATLRTATYRLSEARVNRRQSRHEALRRETKGYADGIAEARRLIPEDGEYLLVEGRPGDGSHFFVAFDLAPRRPWNLGERMRSPDAMRSAGRPPGAPPWVVVSYTAKTPPEVLSTDDFFAAPSPGPTGLTVTVQPDRP